MVARRSWVPTGIISARKNNSKPSLETAHQRVDKKEEALKSQQAKVAESEAKGHGRRLEQRQGKLVPMEHELKDATGNRRNSLSKPPTWARADSGPIATFASRRS